MEKIYYVQAVRRDDGWIITERTKEFGEPYTYRYVATVPDLPDADHIAWLLNDTQDKGL